MGCLLWTHASTLARSSAFTITISARGKNQRTRQGKNLGVSEMRQDNHCSLKWALDRYQPSLSPVIEGVSVTVLIATAVLGLGHAEQQAICWLLFWQNCQGLSSIKWWMELRGSKESKCVCLACVFLCLRRKRYRKPVKRFVNSGSSLAI